MVSDRYLKFYLRHQLVIINFIVGAVTLTLELTASRIAAPYIGLTTYVWTSIIGVILASLAIGYMYGGKLADKRKKPLDVAYILLISATAVAALNIFKDPFLHYFGDQHLSPQLQALFSSIVLFALPTTLLGSASAYLARLSIKTLNTSGENLSRVSAAGTFGSLFGTFFTGFFLFSIIGTRNILSLLVCVLIIASYLIATTKLSRIRSLLTVVALAGVVMPSKLVLVGAIKDFDTSYNRYIIIDSPSYRFLQGDAISYQSGVYKKSALLSPTPYIRALVTASDLHQNPGKLLVVGGGAYTLPNILSRTRPNAKVDVVEIDQELQSISQQYFGFLPTDNISFFNEDGRRFLNNNKTKYDVIFLDAFSNTTPPFQLLSAEADSLLEHSLSDEGILAVNILSSPGGAGEQYVSSIYKTYTSVFSNVKMFLVSGSQAFNEPQSILLIASQKPLDNAIERVAKTNSEFGGIASRLLKIDSNKGRLLTDDFAPVEQMIAKQDYSAH